MKGILPLFDDPKFQRQSFELTVWPYHRETGRSWDWDVMLNNVFQIIRKTQCSFHTNANGLNPIFISFDRVCLHHPQLYPSTPQQPAFLELIHSKYDCSVPTDDGKTSLQLDRLGNIINRHEIWDGV